MDGVESLNNILVIGMTNRKDMIDPAILRPGRMEIHLEIGLPDEHGRKQILEIHTKSMREHDLLESDVDLAYLAETTVNYTGAELEAVCRSATSFALFKGVGTPDAPNEPSSVASGIKVDNKKKKKNQFAEHKVTMANFQQALKEIRPAFGTDNSGLESRLLGGFYNYSETFDVLYQRCLGFLKEIEHAQKTQMLTLLLDGPSRSGKTALAAKLALESQFPFVQMISPEQFVGNSEFVKIQKIAKIFDDAYKSDLSLIILDDLERLIEFIHIGPRFSNTILQALLVLVKKRPPTANRKLMIIGTTSMKGMLAEMDLVDCFNVCQSVPLIHAANEVASVAQNFKCDQETAQAIGDDLEAKYSTQGISMRNLLMAIESSLQKSASGQVELEHVADSLSATMD